MPDVDKRKLTPKENYLRILTNREPEWVPMYTMGFPMADGSPIPLAWVAPPVINQNRPMGGKDVWGVNWVGNYETGNALLPEPGNFILKDITKWRDIIKAPDLSDYDFEAMVKKDLDEKKINRDITGLGQDVFIGFFQMLMAFMGFTEGLCALYEEPEEVKALLEYIGDFYISVEEKCFEYYKPDVLVMADDSCSWNAPFISEDMFREFFVPMYKREARIANEAGIPIQFHNCGMAGHFIEICHDEFNVTGWDPAQICNDLVAFKERNHGEIAILGGWDGRGRLLEDDVTDEEIIDSVHSTIDKLAPNGAYAFLGMFLGAPDDKITQHKNEVLTKAATEYCNYFYD